MSPPTRTTLLFALVACCAGFPGRAFASQDGPSGGSRRGTPEEVVDGPERAGPVARRPLPIRVVLPQDAAPTPEIIQGSASLPLLIWRGDPAAWQWWWWLHRGELLGTERLAAARQLNAPLSGAPSDQVQDLDLAAATRRALAADALLGVLERDGDPAVRREALLSLGRLGGARVVGSAGEDSHRALVSALGASSREVSESAIVGLGLSGSRDGVIELAAILRDDERGRKSLGTERIDERRRSLAAYAIALASNRTERPELVRFASHHLMQVFVAEEGRDELGAAVVVSLGALPGDSPALDSEEIVLELLARLDRRRGSRMVRAQIPLAVARLAASNPELHETASRSLIERIKTRGRGDEGLREAAVIGLGMLGDADGDEIDRDIRAALALSLRKGGGLERRYAAIALGQVGARPGGSQFGSPFAATTQVESVLAEHVSNGRSREQVWGGLALGQMGIELASHKKLLSASGAGILLGSLEKSRSAEGAIGYSIACSLIGDNRARAAILDRLEALADRDSRSQLAFALGHLGGGGVGAELAVAELRAGMERAWPDADQASWYALALGLSGDLEVRDTLAQTLDGSRSSTDVSACARGLAWLGGPVALDRVVDQLEVGDLDVEARAALARGAGWIGDLRGDPWNVELALGVNPRLAPSSLLDYGGAGTPGLLDWLLP